jgi:hypothetical protein
MPEPVEDDLRNRPFAVRAFARRLIINSLSEAGDRSLAILGVRVQDEAACGRVRPADERSFGILFRGFLR